MAPISVRAPAVAGRFYPANLEDLAHEVDTHLAPGAPSEGKIPGAIGCVVPHAGYMYSGHVAGAVYQLLPPRSRYIILGPNHWCRGARLSVMSAGQWLTPLGRVAVDAELANRLLKKCDLLAEDANAHASEHSLEVQLPFLQRLRNAFTFVPIAIGPVDFDSLVLLGHAVAQAIQDSNEPVLMIASSDMNHYEPDGVTREKDQKAIEKILQLDPAGLLDVIEREDISMCGYGPAIVMLTAASDLGAKKGRLIKYATSADTGGDPQAVVGYAGIIIS
ncbi:MAG TPA: AmmeMemoRadiSam system protein B [Terriglobia bacterium]|nr:AmmeMemoRadiSam system protein B [Terriglobia bacterium]